MMKAEKSIVKLNQNQIKNKVFLVANTKILPYVEVNNDTPIGAGSVVTKDVNINTTVIGIPAKPFNY